MSMIQSSPVADTLDVDGEVIVLFGTTIARLSPLGAAILELTTKPTTVDDVASALEEQFGRPPSGTTLNATLAAVAELEARGALVQLSDAG